MSMRRAPFIAVLVVGTAAFGSPADPCSLSSAVTDAKVSVAISNGRTSFREGEIIPLVLSFTSTTDKRYWADNRNYDRSGRLNIETYCVEPAAPDPLADYFRPGMFMGGGLGNEQQLSEKPFTATAELNEWRRPGPGHYRLYVVSYRVWRPPDPNESTPYGVPELQAEGQETAVCEHAGRRLSAPSSGERGSIGEGRYPSVRVSQPTPQSRVVPGSHEDRSKDGADSASPLECEDDAAALRSQRVGRSNGSSGIGASGFLATAGYRSSELNHGWRLGGEKYVTIAKAKKNMVGTRRLELLTSTVSKAL